MEWFGWAGTLLFIICYAPQIYKTKKSKSIGGVSVGMWLIQWAAYTCCLVYSIAIKSPPLMFGYAMGWLITAWWLEMARQYRDQDVDHQLMEAWYHAERIELTHHCKRHK